MRGGGEWNQAIYLCPNQLISEFQGLVVGFATQLSFSVGENAILTVRTLKPSQITAAESGLIPVKQNASGVMVNPLHSENKFYMAASYPSP